MIYEKKSRIDGRVTCWKKQIKDGIRRGRTRDRHQNGGHKKGHGGDKKGYKKINNFTRVVKGKKTG